MGTASVNRVKGPRVLLAFSPAWEGDRPAHVVMDLGEAQIDGPDGSGITAQRVRANVMLDGYRDEQVLARFRQRPQGNTVQGAVFDPLDEADRDRLREQMAMLTDSAPIGVWFEWPPR